MKQSKKLIVSVVAGMGMFCGLYKADAQFAVSPNLAPVGVSSQVNGVTYGYGGTAVLGINNYDEVTNANTSYAVGFERTNDSAGALVWYTNHSTGTPIYIGFQAADNPGVYGKYGVTNTGGNLAFNFPANSTISSAPQQADPYLLTSTGIIAGSVTRNYISGTTNTGRGTDAWIYTPGTNTQNTSTGIYTPTVVNPQGSINDSNGVVSNYFYTNTSGPNNVTASVQAVNILQQVVGNSTRYTGTFATTSLGQDAWLSTQTSASSSTPILLGLGSGTSTATSAHSYTSSGNIIRSSAVISSGTVANNRGLIDTGEAAGTTNRYDDATPSGILSTSAGTDSWVYLPSTMSVPAATYQVGLVGGNYQIAAGSSNAVTTAVPYEFSKVSALNPSGQVAGLSYTFNGAPGGVALNTGYQAWVYTPTGTPGTSTALGSNGYVQVGLTDAAVGSTIGHTSTTAFTGSFSPPGAVSIASGTGATAANGYALLSGLSSNGYAAGISARVDTAGDTALGADAWVNTTNVSPVALYNANPSKVSYYQPNVPTTGMAPYTVPTVATGTQGLPSIYVVGADNSGLSPGYSTMSVVGMNSTGLTVGTIVRTAVIGTSPTAVGTNIGQDLWVYDPSNQNEYILAAPTTGGSGNYGSITFQSVSDTGVVSGYYLTNAAQTTSSTTGEYLFDWSEATGLVTLDQLFNGSAGSPTYLSPNNALLGQTNAADLFTNGLSVLTMFGDSSGNLYLDGNTSATTGVSNGAFEISAAVPEPTSATLLLMGTAGLLSRRRRRVV